MNKTKLIEAFEKHQLDVLYSTAEQTRLWYSKVITSAGFLFIEKNAATLFLDGRYIEYGRANAQNVEVKLLKKRSDIVDFATSKNYKRIGVEADYLTVDGLNYLKKIFPNSEIIFINGQELRILKSDSEIALMKKAGQISLAVLEKIKPLIKPGVSEAEIDAELEKEIRLSGASKGSFDAIVASGKRAALPHGRASDKILEEGDFLTIDFGVIYQGYCSDITRTFHVGKVTNPKLLEIEQILREAQKLGVAAVKPGVSTNDIDKVCRDYITKHGYGEYFVHSTGHGLGIDVHELPNVSSNKLVNRILKPGMVITVEPGIYLENIGGIRVEDDVLVTKDGHQVLSKKA